MYRLTMQRTSTPLNSLGVLELENTIVYSKQVLSSWSTFNTEAILNDIYKNCRHSPLTLEKLVNWHKRISKQTLIVGETKLSVYNRSRPGCTLEDNYVFELEII